MMPTPAITTLRSTLATTLTNNGVWSIFEFPPETPLANSCVILPADPYIVPNNNNHITIAPLARFVVQLFVPMLDNKGNLNTIENFVYQAIDKLGNASYALNISDVSAPVNVSLVTGDLLGVEITVEILTTWSST